MTRLSTPPSWSPRPCPPMLRSPALMTTSGEKRGSPRPAFLLDPPSPRGYALTLGPGGSLTGSPIPSDRGGTMNPRNFARFVFASLPFNLSAIVGTASAGEIEWPPADDDDTVGDDDDTTLIPPPPRRRSDPGRHRVLDPRPRRAVDLRRELCRRARSARTDPPLRRSDSVPAELHPVRVPARALERRRQPRSRRLLLRELPRLPRVLGDRRASGPVPRVC
jgi:hypothetical protein